MTVKTVIKHLEVFCDIKDYSIRDNEIMSILLTWKGSNSLFRFIIGLHGITKWSLYHMLTKQLDTKPGIDNNDLLFWFNYLTKKQQWILYNYNPSLYGKVYKGIKNEKDK